MEENKDMKLYYNFEGNFKWFNSQIKEHKYNALKYLQATTSKDESNFTIIISDSDINENFKKMTLIFNTKFLLIFPVKKVVAKDINLNKQELSEVFKYLKETIVEEI